MEGTADLPSPRPLWRRLPRPVYWIVGAVVALSGAAIARSISEDLPIAERVPYWLAGSTIIFIGLFILSLGTRSRIQRRPEDDD